MTFNFYFDVASIIAFLVLIVMVISTKHIMNSSFKILCHLTVAAFLVPVFDICRADAVTYRFDESVVLVFNMLFFMAHTFVTFYFLMFVMSQVEMTEVRTKVKNALIYTPLAICVILILLMPKFNTIFYYNLEEGFVRGPLYPLVNIVPAGYFIWTLIYTYRKRELLDKSFKKMIILVTAINLITIIVQIFWPNAAIRSFMLSMSAFIMYFFEEHGRAHIEDDTNLVDKDYLIETGLKMVRNEYPFSIILIRIANYDALSDTFGHNNTKALALNIASHVGNQFDLGSCFRISESTIAILNTETEKTEELTNRLYDELSNSWEIEGLDISCDILMTHIEYPGDTGGFENVVALVRYFNNMERSVGGVIDIKELNISEHIRVNLVENAIERGLKNNNFEVYYQPIRDLDKDTFVTAEALVRLTDPELGSISPAEFIPIAENNGTIVAIGDFVLETVCKFVADNDMEKLGLHYIELNLSVIQCLQKDFIENVESIVKKYNIDPKYLCLEVTETASNYSPTVFTKNLEALGERGYSLALDDFGTGYANIERMVTSDFRIVKFDKEMTQYSTSEERLQNVFAKLQNVIHSMDSMVVAEGVETKEQYDYLKKIGCDYIQGYYFSKPVPQEEFVEFIRENNA